MSKNNETGKKGEEEVVELVPCPNCSNKLMLLPQSFPLYDIQCTTCFFRAQVKTGNYKISRGIRGAGWNIMEKVLKSGYQVPPLIVNSKWKGRQEIRFYPFIPKKSLKSRIAIIKSKDRGEYPMFDYKGVDKLPYFVLYEGMIKERKK